MHQVDGFHAEGDEGSDAAIHGVDDEDRKVCLTLDYFSEIF